MRINEEEKEAIRNRLHEIYDYLLTEELLFNLVAEDLLREKSILSYRLKRLEE